MIAYSTYSTKGWAAFKSMYPKKSERDYCEFASRLWNIVVHRTQTSNQIECWDRDSVYVDNVLEFLWRYRKITHYFLAPGISDFCVSSVKELSSEYCKVLPECEPVEYPCCRNNLFVSPLSYFNIGSSNNIQGAFAIHFQAKEHSRSIMVVPNAMIPLIVNGVKSALSYYFVANDGENTAIMQQSAKIMEYESDSDTYWMTRLIFGFSLYMDAFPDAVIQATKSNIHQIKHYDGNRLIVNRNDIVEEDISHSMSPHWRRGHFRLLSSDRFIRKKGHTVFVRGTFVKGMAFDVV